MRMKPINYLGILLLFITSNNYLFGSNFNTEDSCVSIAIKPLQDFPITANTGEKPQSKVWFYDDLWWAVLPNANGTKLWQLTNTNWESVLHLSDSTNVMADVCAIENVTHILLFNNCNTELISVEYNTDKKRYQIWSKRHDAVKIKLEKVSETATIDVDLSGRMWLAFDDQTEVHVRWSDSPYDV